jgi:8-oxo-dGTP pyrophosphatase MutT (NUDIX family)
MAMAKASGLDLDLTRAATVPRPASTVLVLRDDGTGAGAAERASATSHDAASPARGAGSLAVYVIVRHPKSGFLGGVVAFPGGKVDAGDDDDELCRLATPLSPRMEDFARTESPDPAASATLPVSARAFAVAALRECLEEAALLPTLSMNVSVAGPDDAAGLSNEAVVSLRTRVEGGASLAKELTRLGLHLDAGGLAPFARWVTPVAEARRFDALFFLLARPEGQEGAFDGHETTAGEWATPASLIDRFHRGELQIAPPTLRCLELLLPCQTVAEAFALAAVQDLRPVCPHVVPAGDDVDTLLLVLPGDPRHPVQDQIVKGPSRFALRDGRFVSEAAPTSGS